MSIPYNDCLRLDQYYSNPNWYEDLQDSSRKEESQSERAIDELFANALKQPIVRTIQLIRDTLRLVLKVPIRALATPIFLEENWQERERAKVNAKLTGYAFVQLLSVPVKFLCALIALGISTFSSEKAEWLLDTSEEWTAYIDGRTSQLEALKEEGAKKCQSREEFDAYRDWLYGIDPKLCRQID
jgi:hypothetical protein